MRSHRPPQKEEQTNTHRDSAATINRRCVDRDPSLPTRAFGRNWKVYAKEEKVLSSLRLTIYTDAACGIVRMS